MNLIYVGSGFNFKEKTNHKDWNSSDIKKTPFAISLPVQILYRIVPLWKQKPEQNNNIHIIRQCLQNYNYILLFQCCCWLRYPLWCPFLRCSFKFRIIHCIFEIGCNLLHFLKLALFVAFRFAPTFQCIMFWHW